MNGPNYRDFYQKALIPIGLKDQAALLDLDFHQANQTLFPSHWLIALESVLASSIKEYYHWKVSIYPSNFHGTFQWDHPFYSFPPLESIDNALEIVRMLEAYCKSDELLATNLQEKIS